jgi:hypothetical protein
MRQSLSALYTLVLLPYLVLVWTLWFVCDDAYISFRYAKNAALGHGFRYNLGEHVPVEGYSNFLWTLVASWVERIGADPATYMPALSALTGAALLWHVVWTARRLGLSPEASAASGWLLACSPVVGAWASGGLATMPATWALFATFERAVLARGTGAIAAAAGAAAALSLLRTEGPAWVMVVVVLAWAVRHREGEREAWREPLMLLAATAITVGLHVGWRWTTYGDLVSNTARAKVGMSLDRLLRGATYVFATWLALITPACMLGGIPHTIRRLGPRGVALSLMAIAVPTWCVVVGGDYMAFGRMLLAGLPFAALAAGVAYDALRTARPKASRLGLLTLLVVGALPAFNLAITPTSITAPLHFRVTTPYIQSEWQMWKFMRNNAIRWTTQGQALAQLDPSGSLVTGAIGARGYYSGLFFHDRGGLVTRGLQEHASQGHMSSPGHDIQAPRSAFLPLEPTWMNFKLLAPHATPQIARRELKKWRVPTSWRTEYAPVLRPVELDGDTQFLLLLERAPDAKRATKRWDTFPETADRLLRN